MESMERLNIDNEINLIKEFLDSNYLSSSESRLVYPKDLLKWVLKDSVIIGMFKNNVLIGMISGRLIKINNVNVVQDVYEVNFLSVLETFRKKGVAKKLRLELQKYSIKTSNVFYTTSYPLKNPPFCITAIKHLNLERKRKSLLNNDFLIENISLNLREMIPSDIPSVVELLEILEQDSKVSIKLDKQDLLNLVNSPIKCFVSVEQGKVTGFVSFYQTTSEKIKTRENICNLYYYTDIFVLNKFIIMICKNFPNFSEIRCQGVGNNSMYLLSEIGFCQGTGILYYNMYNLKSPNYIPNFYTPEKINLLMI
jgi:hypothetical protein